MKILQIELTGCAIFALIFLTFPASAVAASTIFQTPTPSLLEPKFTPEISADQSAILNNLPTLNNSTDIDASASAKPSIDHANSPVAIAGSDIIWGIAPLTISFSSYGSYDPEGKTLTYLWDFGDNTASNSAHPVKTYTKQGNYTASLFVSNGTATSSAVTLDIQVGIPPSVLIEQPYSGTSFRLGEIIPFSILAVDGNRNVIDESAIQTELLMRSGNMLSRVGEIQTGYMGSFTITDTPSDAMYELKTTAHDQNGLTATTSALLYPQKTSITLLSNPSGLKASIDSKKVQTPYTFETVVNKKHEITTDVRQTIWGKSYDFSHWNEENQRTLSIQASELSKSLTAEFIPVTEQQYIGEYFNNPSLSGEPQLLKVSKTIDFDWKNHSPDPLISTDNFSIRWKKTETATTSGTYRFSVTADDGLRLYIDGNKILDQWIDQSAATYAADIHLEKGEHTVVMEYYDHSSDAVAMLRTEYLDESKTLETDQTKTATSSGFLAQYFGNPTLSGAILYSQEIPNIRFEWEEESPNPSIPADNFSARYTKTERFGGGEYRFLVTANDGVRIYLDEDIIFDQWKEQSSPMYTFFSAIPSGMHTIKVEYYDKSSEAKLFVSWALIE